MPKHLFLFIFGIILTFPLLSLHADNEVTTSSQIQSLGWNHELGNGEFEPLIEDFDPKLTPVEISSPRDPEEIYIAREGKGWIETSGYDDSARRILHLKGTPYEMGYQHGKLMKWQVRQLVNTILYKVGFYDAFRENKSFIQTLREIYTQCGPYIPKEYLEEARGLAQGAGVPYEAILLANLFPERFHCSGFALWGKATADGKLYHGRILDYMIGIGLQKYATVIIYEPDGKIPWVNIGYAGFIGTVTGMNAQKIALGEMGGKGEKLWKGMPMSFLMRHILENCSTYDRAVKMFQDTPRTCEYYYVLSDGKTNQACGIAATPDKLDIILEEHSDPRLPNPIKNGVLLSAGDRYKRLVMRTQAAYGTFTEVEALALMRRPVAMQSNLHSVLFCPTDGRFFVSDASIDEQPASEQPYDEYNLNDLLAAQPPIEQSAKAE